jgi:hypothetical protein
MHEGFEFGKTMDLPIRKSRPSAFQRPTLDADLSPRQKLSCPKTSKATSVAVHQP